MGVYPQPFLRRMDRSVSSIMLRLEKNSLVITDRTAPPIPHTRFLTPHRPLPTADCLLPTASAGGGR